MPNIYEFAKIDCLILLIFGNKLFENQVNLKKSYSEVKLTTANISILFVLLIIR